MILIDILRHSDWGADYIIGARRYHRLPWWRGLSGEDILAFWYHDHLGCQGECERHPPQLVS